MKYLVIIRSRAELRDFADKMQALGAYANVVPLPKEAKTGCGICAEISGNFLPKAKKVIAYYSYSSFYGIFSFDERRKKLARVW